MLFRELSPAEMDDLVKSYNTTPVKSLVALAEKEQPDIFELFGILAQRVNSREEVSLIFEGVLFSWFIFQEKRFVIVSKN